MALVLSVGLAMQVAAQDAPLRLDVKLVNVFVNVTDSTGAIVGGLNREDFAISEDGRPQKIQVFERQRIQGQAG
jgi:Ca-activated chloride channel family protein